MPSIAWQEWDTTRSRALNDIEAAHHRVGGTGRGRRFATEQINHVYAVLLASQFQGFCRDLHSECVACLVRAVAPALVQSVLRAEFLFNRSLDRGNANPSTIGSDFNRLGVEFWRQVYADRPHNERRKGLLEQLNQWRNAIAHHDFDPATLGGTTRLHLHQLRAWRRACNRLARSFDDVMQAYLTGITGFPPGKEVTAMAAPTRSERPFERPRFKVGDRVSLRLGLQNSLGTIIEDRGFLGSGGRRLYRVKVDFDPPNVTFIELPEEDLRAMP
jgi:hypothetical protein